MKDNISVFFYSCSKFIENTLKNLLETELFLKNGALKLDTKIFLKYEDTHKIIANTTQDIDRAVYKISISKGLIYRLCYFCQIYQSIEEALLKGGSNFFHASICEPFEYLIMRESIDKLLIEQTPEYKFLFNNALSSEEFEKKFLDLEKKGIYQGLRKENYLQFPSSIALDAKNYVYASFRFLINHSIAHISRRHLELVNNIEQKSVLFELACDNTMESNLLKAIEIDADNQAMYYSVSSPILDNIYGDKLEYRYMDMLTGVAIFITFFDIVNQYDKKYKSDYRILPELRFLLSTSILLKNSTLDDSVTKSKAYSMIWQSIFNHFQEVFSNTTIGGKAFESIGNQIIINAEAEEMAFRASFSIDKEVYIIAEQIENLHKLLQKL